MARKMQKSARLRGLSRWTIRGLLLSLLPGALYAAAELTQRYPYDPACPWGRVANGKGMIHRCINKAEAEELSKVVLSGEKTPEKIVLKQKAKAKAKAYELKVGPISSKDGDITIGALHKPQDRYRQCINAHGGLQESSAKAVIQFLVRAERGRAEGVEVKSVKGLSKETAQCLADVVDRRKVGNPSQEIMAVELIFEAQASE